MGTTNKDWTARLWAVDAARLPKWQRTGLQVVRVLAGTVREFLRHNCPLQASALTYITLMSMVPVLALMFSVSKGFGAHERLMEMVNGKLQTLPPGVVVFARQVFDYVDKTNFSTLGVVGLLLLLWSVVGVMGKIEGCFNAIWRVRTPRTMVRKVEDYISILVVVPILFMATMSVNTALSSGTIVSLLREHLGPFYRVFEVLISLGGAVCVSGAFAIFYVFMPNTRVRWGAALAGGVITGVVWQVTQWVYIKFQVGVAGYNAIYGTFAVIPFFLAWLYLNWMIVLVGAALCYAIQNRAALDPEAELAMLTPVWREELALWLMADCCGAHQRGGEVWRVAAFAGRNGLPPSLVLEMARLLVARGLLLEVAGSEGGFVPGRAAGELSAADVAAALGEAGGVPERWRNLPPADHPTLAALREKRTAWQAALRTVSLAGAGKNQTP